jgi:hypothetical protein
MLMIIHIICGVVGVSASALAIAKPHKIVYGSIYVSMAATFISGGALVMFAQASLTRLCASGLMFTLLVSGLTFTAKQKELQAAKQRI